MRNTMLSSDDDQSLQSTTFDFFLPQMPIQRPRSRNRRNNESTINNNPIRETDDTTHSSIFKYNTQQRTRR